MTYATLEILDRTATIVVNIDHCGYGSGLIFSSLVIRLKFQSSSFQAAMNKTSEGFEAARPFVEGFIGATTF